MPAEYAWVVPTLEKAYEHREDILGLWQRLLRAIRPTARVSMVGMAGVGKTAVLRALSRKPLPDGTSRDREPGRIEGIAEKIDLITVPGQIGQERDRLLDEELQDPPVGVIYFTAFGYSTIRSDVARAELQRLYPGVDDIRKNHMRSELDVLRELSDRIAKGLRRGDVKWRDRMPRFLLVVPTKIDLYYDRITAARDYYSVEGNGEFADELRSLRSRVGEQNLRIESIPVSAGDEAFGWGEGEPVTTQLLERHRSFFQNQLVRAIAELCRAVDGV
ncbi:MAG: hypothetical protein AB1Z98_28620 [Nannocystaceae bacterium]